jgi:hypothetical protein
VTTAAEILSPRRSLRIPLRTEVLVGEARKPRFLGYAANLSETGAFIQCMNSRPIGTRFSLRIHLPGSVQESLALEAEVIWQRGYAGRHGACPGMGIRFLHVGSGPLARLRALCEDRDLPVSPPRIGPPAGLQDPSAAL